MSPLLSTIGSLSSKAYGFLSRSISRVIDNFNRTTSGSLGTSSGGNIWQATRGIWYANGTAAQNDEVASGYPLVSVPFKVNNIMTAEVTGGVGIAYWVTDAGSWWASYPTYTTSTSASQSCSGGPASCSSGCNCSPSGCCTGVSYTNGTFSTGLASTSSCCNFTGYTQTCDAGYTTTAPDTSSCCSTATSTTSWVCPVGYYCASGGGYTNACFSVPGCAGSYITNAVIQTRYSCFTAYSYGCYTTRNGSCSNTFVTVTVTNYETNITTTKSVSNTVTTENSTQLTTNTGGFSVINAMSVVTSGDTIEIRGFSDTARTSQTGSTINLSPTTPTKGINIGIIKAPTANSQGSTLDNFSGE